MADSEAFLSRWSRLKREAAEHPDALGEPAPKDQMAEQSADLEGAANATEPTVDAPPSIDLSALPPIETITATTDIRPFLATGVPVELARAALRRAWVADPKIRDFIEIAENQWDFTAPETIPGFGPLKAIDDIRRLVADVLGDSEPVDTGATPERACGNAAQPVEVTQSAQPIQQAANGQPPADQTSGASVETERNSGVVQHSIDRRAAGRRNDDHEAVTPDHPRRHGSALPE